MELDCIFKDLVHSHHGENHGDIQASMMLEKELRSPHLVLPAAEGDWVPQ